MFYIFVLWYMTTVDDLQIEVYTNQMLAEYEYQQRKRAGFMCGLKSMGVYPEIE